MLDQHSARVTYAPPRCSDFVKSIVFGGLDGVITTFSIVAASAGASLNVQTALLLGVSNLIADGISMGVGDFLSSVSRPQRLHHARARMATPCRSRFPLLARAAGRGAEVHQVGAQARGVGVREPQGGRDRGDGGAVQARGRVRGASARRHAGVRPLSLSSRVTSNAPPRRCPRPRRRTRA